MHNNDLSARNFSWVGDEPRAHAAQADPTKRRRTRQAICCLERELKTINSKIERLQKKRSAFRSSMARELTPHGGKEGGWLSLNSALLLLAWTLDGVLPGLPGFNPFFPGMLVVVMLALWMVYIHLQIVRERNARFTDRLLRAQILDQFTRMDTIRRHIEELRKTNE